MTTSIPLKSATAAYAVANTHLFLVRKLLEDELIRRWAKPLEIDEINALLESAISEKPADLEAEVRPYAYLAALAGKAGRKALAQAESRSAPYHPWYGDVCDALGSLTPSVTVSNVRPSAGQLMAPLSTTDRSSRSEFSFERELGQ